MPYLLLIFLLAWPASAFAQVHDVEGTPASIFYSISARGDTLFAGADGVVWISFDRGSTWRATNPVPDAASIDAVIATEAGWFVGCFDRGVYRSVDGGETWSPLDAGLTGTGSRDITDFEIHREMLYAATGGAGVFALDLADPRAWQRFGTEFAANEASTVPSLALDDGYLIAVAGGNGLVMRRNVDEEFWMPVQAAPLQLLSVARTDLGLFTSSRRSAFRSNDQGATWASTGQLPSGIFSSIASVGDGSDSGTWIAVVTIQGGSQLFRYTEPMNAWEWMEDLPQTIAMLTFDGRLYLATQDGLKTRTIEPVTGTPSPWPVMRGLSVETPMPHPVVDRAALRVLAEHPGDLRLEVIDMLGRVVAVPFQGIAEQGGNRVDFDSSRLPSGIYLLRATSGRTTASRPVVISR